MNKEDKRRLIIIVTVIIAAVILWLLLRGKGGLNSIINQNGDLAFNIPGMDPWGEHGIPPLTYDPANVSIRGGSKGCILCYSGYQRIEVPALPVYAPREQIPAPQIYNYINNTTNYSTTTGGSWGMTAEALRYSF